MRGMNSGFRVLLLGLVMALLVGACGQMPDAATEPRAAVKDALERMASWDGGTATFSIDATVPSLLAAFAEDGLDVQTAQILLDSSLTISALLGDDPADRADGETSVTLNLGGFDVVSFVQLYEDVYFRIDLDRIVDLFDREGIGRAELDAVQVEAEAYGLDFAADLRGGSWLKVEGFQQVQSMLEGMLGAPSPPDPAELEALAPQLKDAFERFLDAEVDFAFIGNDDYGDRVRVTTTAEALIDLGEVIFSIAGGLMPATPGMNPDQMFEELRREVGTEAEGFTIPLDVWIASGVISRVAFDVVALAEANPEHLGKEMPDGVERLAIAVDLSEFGGGVEAPSGAIEIDLFEIVGRFMGLGGMLTQPDA